MEKMSIRRTVPNIESEDPKQSREFFERFLGMEVAMDKDWIITFASPNNPTAQINVILHDGSDVPHPNISIEVDDVDDMYSRAVDQKIEIVYSITDEPWGVRRFFVVGPNNTIVNILSHL
ncbi:MAG TPA: VOC family protein [Balneolaceae bacterium]